MSGSYGAKEEIKMKTDIVALMSEYVRIKKAGASFMAVCPFHSEKTASLHISPDKGMWYCHGCGEGGDVFGFIMRMEGLDFMDAMRFLAKKAGVQLSENETREQTERQRLVKINAAAAKYYHEVLRKSSQAERARAYVAKRQLNEQTVDDFMLGFAPDSWDAVMGFLRQKGVPEDQMYAAGLVSKSDRGRGYYDRFRGRLMFPILDHNANVVGFTARVMPGPDGKDPKDEAKYVNTSQTLVYNKSHVLYGLHAAKQEIKKKDLAVVVEGNMDVIASHQAGVKNVVASSGTSFTHEQLQLLKRFTERLVLSFDNDPAGESAARRSIDAAVAAGFSVRILRLPDGVKDPDDCVRKGVDLWSKAIADAVPYMEWYMALAKGRTDVRDPEAMRDASNSLIKEVAKLASPVERSYWIRELSQLFETPESALFDAVQRASKAVPVQGEQAPKKPAVPLKPRLSRQGVVSQHIFGLALGWADLAEATIAAVPPDHMDDGDMPLYTEFVVRYHAESNGGAPASTFRTSLEAQGHREFADRAAVLELLAEREFGGLAHDLRRDALVRLIGELKQLHKSRRQRELTHAMADAEKAGDMAAIADIQRQLNELIV
ncbi:MAG TPA: DNA primase [Candidatus Binatia bacterium]|jgi:DNA primase|nr:DNA primase [Candidatus Binatia bacterium]